MKYRPSYLLTRIVGRIMADHVMATIGRHDLVVPIPISTQSYRIRGFNQSAVIAQIVGKRLGVKYKGAALKHLGYKQPQATLPAAKRWENVKSAFKARKRTVSGKSVLLIDDVVTTGATTNIAAQKLLEAGARSVTLYAFARSQRHN